MTVAAEVGERDRFALRAGKRRESSFYAFGVKPQLDHLGDVVVRLIQVAGAYPNVARASGLRGADSVNRSRVRTTKNPADRAALLRIETARELPHIEEHLLGDLLGVTGIAKNPGGEAEHARHHPVIELGECGAASACNGLE